MKFVNVKLLALVVSAIFVVSSCGVKEELAKLDKKITLISQDEDQDGVPNAYDRDTDSPVESMVYGNGSSVDTDMDGIPDYKDEELISPYGAVVDTSGVATDNDNDGVADKVDMEPETPEGAMVNFQGKSISAAKSSGSAVGAGSGSAVSTNSIVFFPVNSSYIKKDELTKLVNIALAMKMDTTSNVTLLGYSDESGADDYNLKVSEKRAEAVAKILVDNFNIPQSRIVVKGMGEQNIIAFGDLSYFNRRVEFIFE